MEMYHTSSVVVNSNDTKLQSKCKLQYKLSCFSTKLLNITNLSGHLHVVFIFVITKLKRAFM